MPVSSHEVNSIIQAQLSTFSASAQYAQSITAQYAFATPPPPEPGVAGLQAGMIGSGMARVPDMAASAVSGAAMFGLGPRLFDPFGGAFAAGQMGYRGAGLAGGIGMGLGAFGAYTAAGSAMGWATDQVAGGAQMRGLSNSMIGSAMPNASATQLNSMSGMMENMSRGGVGSMGELTALMSQGIQSGSLDQTTMSRFQTSFSSLVTRVREVATVLNSTLSEAHHAIETVRGLGVSEAGAPGMLGMMRGMGGGAGLSPMQTAQAVASGASFGRMSGIDPDRAAGGALTSTGVYKLALDSGLHGVTAESYGAYSQGAMRFLSSRPGQQVLGAIMNEHGEIDSDAAEQVMSGAIGSRDIAKRYRERTSTRRGADLLRSRSSELAASLITQYGPESLVPAMREMASESSSPDAYLQQLHGMTRADFAGMSTMHTAGAGLKQRLISQAVGSMQQDNQPTGAMEAISRSMGALTAPLKRQLEEYGAMLTGVTHEAMEEVTRQFVAKAPIKANPRAYADYFRASISGRSWYTGMIDSSPGTKMGLPEPIGGFASSLPGVLSSEAMGAGSSPLDMPMYGLATSEYNPYLTAGALAMQSNVVGRAGRAAFNWGSDAVGGFGGLAKGMFKDYGMGAGLRRLGAGGAMVGGGAASFVGGLGKMLGPAAIAADIGFNIAPNMLRDAGVIEYGENAIGGDAAKLMMAAYEKGAPGFSRFSPGSEANLAIARGERPVQGSMTDAGQLYYAQDMDSLSKFVSSDPELQKIGGLVAQHAGDSPDAQLKSFVNTLSSMKTSPENTAAAKGRKVLEELFKTGGFGASAAFGAIASSHNDSGGKFGTPEGIAALASKLRPLVGSDADADAVKALFLDVRGASLESKGDPEKDIRRHLIVPGAKPAFAQDKAGIDEYIRQRVASMALTRVSDKSYAASAATSVGISSKDLSGIVEEYHDAGGDSQKIVGARQKLLEKLETENLTPTAKAALATRFAASGSGPLQELSALIGSGAQASGTVDRYGKKGGNPTRLLSSLLGAEFTGDTKYFSGKSDHLDEQLREQIKMATRNLIGARLQGPAGEGVADNHAEEIIGATRAAITKGDAAGLRVVANKLASFNQPGGPTSNSQTGITDKADDLGRALDTLVKSVRFAAGEIAQKSWAE